MQNELYDTREKLQTVCKVVKDIAYGAAQCFDFSINLCELLKNNAAEKLAQGSKSYRELGGVYSNCYTLRKEGMEDLRVADWSGCSMGITSVTVGCNTLKGYKAWRALLRKM